MPNIFISYSRVDLKFAENLYSRIQQMRPNDRVWYDKAYDGLLGGDSWWDEILDAIAEADIFVYVLSNESVQSKYCQAEFEEARRLQKRIITVQARDRTKLTGTLSDIQYVDMKNGVDDPDALTRLGGALQRQTSLIKNRRAKWRPRTPRPTEETPSTRDESAPEVDTPTLEAPRPTQQNTDSTIKAAYIGGAFLLAGVIIAGLFGLWQGVFANNLSPTNETTGITEIAGDLTETLTLTDTDTLENTPILTTTPNLVEQSQTLVAKQTAQKIINDATATAAQMTLEAQQTLTQPAIEDLEELAKTPVISNEDWRPIEQDFDGVTMVLVPVGRFMMGSDKGGSDEQPVHEQEISEPFWIDKTEVTQANFARLGGEQALSSEFEGSDRPIEQITWFEAWDFCQSRGARLPTEKEWEYVARGPDNLIYPWGNEWNENNAVYNGNLDGQSVEVGSLPEGVSWVGVMDMSGNAWEWLSSLYTDGYPYSDTQEDQSDTVNYRAVRGGSFDEVRINWRSPDRGYRSPDFSIDYLGFRCARS